MNSQIIKKHLIQIMKDFYDDHPVGGALHVVVDDLNISESMIEYFLEKENLGEREKLILLALLGLNAKERYELLSGRPITFEEIIEDLDDEDDKEEREYLISISVGEKE